MSLSLARVSIALTALALTGCLDRMVIRKEADLLRRSAPAVDTLHDYETAKITSEAELGRLEGLHRVAPANEDVLFLLTRGWVLAALRFGVGDYEHALATHRPALARYHLDRMAAAFERAEYYGLELLGMRHGGMKEARETPDELIGWTNNRPTGAGDAAPLLWTGLAFVGEAFTRDAEEGDEKTGVDDRRVGRAMLERSAALDETVHFGLANIALGFVEPDTASAEGAASHLHRAISLTDGRYLPARLALALSDCRRGLGENARLRFDAILGAGDLLPEARLDNAIAMQRAKRYLAHPELDACGRGAEPRHPPPGQRPSETRTSTKRPPGRRK